jgi:hypothetical protein
MKQLGTVLLLWLTLAGGIVGPSSVRAQIVETGTMTGVVRDKSGAVIPRARVSIQNSATGITNNTVTDSDGIYVSPPLTPGDYNVVFEVPGFDKVQEHIRLEVGQRAAVPAQTQIVSVPYTQQRGPSSYAFNGLRYQENRVLLDGIGDNENHNGLAVVVFPPIDAIQEFSEETSDADARYGRGNAGTVNLIFKSGTNKYHGELFEFVRNSVFDARNYFDTAAKPPFHMNEFGGTFGGPLFRRDNPSTFFFVDYSGQRTRQGLTYVDTVPAFKLTSTRNQSARFCLSAIRY